MASSRNSLNQIDLTDVAVAWAAFEEINQVMVTINMHLVLRGATREPQLYGVAVSFPAVDGVAKPRDSVSATSWVFSHKSLDTAVFHLLYTLDGLIAEAELANVAKKQA